MATHRVRNIDRLGVEIGQISFVVPRIVLEELHHISGNDRGANSAKKAGALQAMKLAESLGSITLDCNAGDGRDRLHARTTADDLIVMHASIHGGIIATMDRKLKSRLKEECQCTIISFSNDNIVMEF